MKTSLDLNRNCLSMSLNYFSNEILDDPVNHMLLLLYCLKNEYDKDERERETIFITIIFDVFIKFKIIMRYVNEQNPYFVILSESCILFQNLIISKKHLIE